jgi:hypothetical protein
MKIWIFICLDVSMNETFPTLDITKKDHRRKKIKKVNVSLLP